jgi:citrate/tricarballylate utilization protein
MPGARPVLLELIDEGQRLMRICNACRYCEGFCAVFPALERRLDFTEADLHYLANLCHNCGSCYYACQYAPPHEFQLNFPKTLAEIRAATYEKHAWPGWLAGLFERNGVAVGLVTAVTLALFLSVMTLVIDRSVLFSAHPDRAGAFYAVLPHSVMASSFGAVGLLLAVALMVGFVRFWRDSGEKLSSFLTPAAFGGAVWDVLRLKQLDGGGDGCTYPDEQPSLARRRFHHLTFYGFMLCFASTTVAAIYHYVFGWSAPYSFWSLPVLLGSVGGVGLLMGPAGLLWLKARRDPALQDPKQVGMDAGFLVMLFVTSLTGLSLLALRETRVMGVVLAVHLAVVLALFLMLPYGKFVHAIYRFAALVRYHLERRRPLPLLGPD